MLDLEIMTRDSGHPVDRLKRVAVEINVMNSILHNGRI